MLLACTRTRHSRHAKPHPKVILERRKHLFGSLGEGHRLLSFLLLMLLACTRRRHSRHAKPYPTVILERRKHIFGSLGECELHSGLPIALLPTAFWATDCSLACTRRCHGECELHSGPPTALLPTAHASCLHPQAPQSACQTIPASKTPFRITRGCELHSGPPIALLPTAHASCLHPQAPQSACQTIPKSIFGASKHFFGSLGSVNCILGYRLSPSYCSCFLLAPAGDTVGMPNHTQK